LRRRQLWWALALTALLWFGALGAALWWTLSHGVVSGKLRDQAVRLRLPAGMQVHAQVLSPVHADVKMQQDLRVPIDQTVAVALPQALRAHAQVTASLPIDTVIRVRHDVPVSATVQARVPVVRWLPALKVDIPVQFVVPLDMAVPVRLSLPVQLNVDVQGRVPQVLHVPIKTVLALQVPFNERLRIDVMRRTEFQWLGRPAPIDLRILQLPVGLALSDVAWCGSWGCGWLP